MNESNPDLQKNIREAYKDILSQLYKKTDELFDMHQRGIEGLEERIRNPAYGINGDNSEPEFVDDFLSFYQTEGVQFLLDHERVLLADEMGVGKTAQAIAGKLALENLLGRKVPTLIVCPNHHVKAQWESYIKEYLTADRWQKITIENIEAEGYSSAKIKGSDIVLIDYHALSFSEEGENNVLRKQLKNKLMDAGFEYVILDEAHNVKNYTTAGRFKNVHDIASKARYLALLSGTILPNSLRDIYATIALLKPEQTDTNGNKTGYKTASDVAKAHARAPAVLGAILRPVRLERKLEDIKDMPPKNEEYVHIKQLAERQQEAYDTIYEDNSLMGLQKIQKMQQALLNPKLLDPSFADAARAKFEALDDIVEKTIARGEKIVIYSPNFRNGVVDTLEERYSRFGAEHIDGKNRKKRKSIIKKFQKDPSARVLVMNKVGGEGIALTAANNLVFLEEPYSPGERRQVIGRVWRPGQKKPVNIMTLNVDGTIDDGIRKFLEQKKIAIAYAEKGVPLTDEQRLLTNGKNGTALARWLAIDKGYLYTPSQITSILIGKTKEKPEDKVVSKLDDKLGKHLAKSLSESWEGSALGNSSNIYANIFRGIEAREGAFNRIADIACGFGALSHALNRRGIYNVDADRHHFDSPQASKENVNLFGRMTKLPIKEDGTFDFALCSMGLDILPNNEAEPARVKAIAEANRILKTGGHYLITLPGPSVPEDDSTIRETMEESGFEVVPELTGFVRAKDKQVGTNIYVLTARKKDNLPADFNPSQLAEKFKLNSKEEAKKKGTTQRRSGHVTEFEFVRSDGSLEDLVDAIDSFKKGGDAND
ncbi:MAG: SNF2-related protein [Candidatus Woesearchaeota archaeon]|nr:SNF2-related protein [Candidatus Woesearchaeota archaeon]